MDTNQGFDELAAIVQVSPVYYQTVIKCYYTLTRNAGCSAIPSKGDKAACSTLSKIETMPASFFFFKQLHVMQVACYEVKIEGSEKAGVQLPGVKLRTLLA